MRFEGLGLRVWVLGSGVRVWLRTYILELFGQAFDHVNLLHVGIRMVVVKSRILFQGLGFRIRVYVTVSVRSARRTPHTLES